MQYDLDPSKIHAGGTFQTFRPGKNDALKEPMFFGNSVNVSRMDESKYAVFQRLTDKQLSLFWTPDEIDITHDKGQFQSLTEQEQFIFTQNLQYQSLLDSVQGRSVNLALLPIVSLPELETWFETWAFSETIHSRSYTHIIRAIYNQPQHVFNSMLDNSKIMQRAASVTKYYDELIQIGARWTRGEYLDEYEAKKALYLCIVQINILEAVRFYVSFACSFAFAERALMEGNAKIIKLIARDEMLHLVGTQHMIQLMRDGSEGQMMADIVADCDPLVAQMFKEAGDQEVEWGHHLCYDGGMIGLNGDILAQYVRYITNQRCAGAGIDPVYPEESNPIDWVDNNWLDSKLVQIAPQESENSAYLVGALDTSESADVDEFDI